MSDVTQHDEAPASEAPEPESHDDSPEDQAMAARLFRWKPKEEWKGDQSKWVPARAMLDNAGDALRNANMTKAELERERTRTNKLVGQFAQLENRLNTSTMADTEAKMDAAFEAGDVKGYQAAKRELTQLQNAQTRTNPGEAPAFTAFKAENSDWFDISGGKNAEASAYAVSLGRTLGAQFGGDTEEFYAELKRRVEKRFPEINGDPEPAPVRNGVGRQPAVGRPASGARSSEPAKLTIATMTPAQKRFCVETNLKPEAFVASANKRGI